ncbi:MAG: hypothetical protein IT376_08975 [Polyangiaceae bacterium]|nr:hypothetical protein [Polyangiaceae bacterium]
MSVRRALAAAVAAGALHATCSPALPSTRPLGGREEPDAAPDDASDAPAEAAESAAAPEPAPPPPPPAPAASSAAPAASSSAAPVGSAAAAPPPCDDGGPPPRACAGLAGPSGRTDCYLAAGVATLCGMVVPVLKPKVGASWVECLHAKSGTDAMCRMETLLDCAKPAFELACPDPRMKAFCAEVVGRCTDQPAEVRELFTAAMCEKAMSSLTAAARAQVEACMKRSCELESCLGPLLQAPGAPPPPPPKGPPPGLSTSG